MYQGETFPIDIKLAFNPPISVGAITDAHIVVHNNNKKMLQFNMDGSGDGQVWLDNSTGEIFARSVCERDKTVLWNPGEVQIELLIKTTLTGFPSGYVRVAQFFEPVLKSRSIDI